MGRGISKDSAVEALRQRLRETPVGGSFVYNGDNGAPYNAGKSIGIKVKTRILEKGGWLVTRLN